MINSEVDFNKQLKRHVSFISSSCERYDLGFVEEALRIAVSLRVIFHDTFQSKSILTHLNIKNNLSILSSIKNKEENTVDGHSPALMVPFFLTPDGITPQLNVSRKKESISAEEWWNEIIFLQNGEFSRKNVVLSASNQDGGAHVDANPNRKTKILKEGIGTFANVKDGVENKIEFVDYHFQLIRQFGFEVLNSPEIQQIIA